MKVDRKWNERLVTWAIVLVLLLASPALSNAQQQPGAPDANPPDMVAQSTSTLLFGETIPIGQKIHYTNIVTVVDGAANLWHATVRNDGFSAYAQLWKTTPTGQTTFIANVIPPFKADDVSLAISGDLLEVTQVTHNGDNDARAYLDTKSGLGVVPYPHGEVPLGMPGAFVASGTVETGGLTMDELVNALNNGTSPLSAALDRHIKNNADIGAFNALTRYGALARDDNGLNWLRNGLYQWAKDRTFEGSTSALRNAGLPPLPTPTAHP